MNIWIKLDRFFAWVLFICMMLYFISGYGMTKGLINGELAATLHNTVLTYIILIAFVFHSAFAIRLAFIRWKIWDGYGKTLWILFYIVFIGAFVYVDKFYQPKTETAIDSEATASVANNTPSNNSASAVPTSNNSKTFTATELAKYSGKNGNPAYVAVDGVVYDMTNVFNNGYHYGHTAGTELTNSFYTRHVKSAITKYPVVGTYVK